MTKEIKDIKEVEFLDDSAVIFNTNFYINKILNLSKKIVEDIFKNGHENQNNNI